MRGWVDGSGAIWLDSWSLPTVRLLSIMPYLLTSAALMHRVQHVPVNAIQDVRHTLRRRFNAHHVEAALMRASQHSVACEQLLRTADTRIPRRCGEQNRDDDWRQAGWARLRRRRRCQLREASAQERGVHVETLHDQRLAIAQALGQVCSNAMGHSGTGCVIIRLSPGPVTAEERRRRRAGGSWRQHTVHPVRLQRVCPVQSLRQLRSCTVSQKGS